MEPREEQNSGEKIDRLRQAMYSRELSQKLQDKPRRALDDIRPMVGEDWHHPEPEISGTVVAPRTMGIARSALRWVLAGAIVFFLAALTFFAYYFTFGTEHVPASVGNIEILVTGPTQIAGGEPTQLQITVINKNSVDLQLADLLITYPQGTRSPVDLVTDLPSQRITLGTIESGGRRQGTISAVFPGGGTGVANVNVDLEYRLKGSSAIFVATTDYVGSYSTSALSISIEGNTETVSGQPVELTVNITSNAVTPVKDVLVNVGFPFGFSFTSGVPKPTRGSLWELGDIGPGQKKQIVIRGTLSGESGDERMFRFSAGTRKTPEEQAITTLLADGTFAMQVASPFLGLSVAVDGRSGSGIVVGPGETVNVSVAWQNNLETPVTDAVVVARLSGLQIDGAQVKTTNGFFRSTDGAVLWDKTTTNGALTNLTAGARGNLTFSFRMPDAATLEAIRNPSLTISVNAAGKRLSEEGVPENLQSTAVQRVGVASALAVTTQGLYYANPFGSTGPLPPKSGTETTYAIVFSITNTTNVISDARITASLPPYVRWTGVYSPGSENVSFNQNDGTVTWNIGTIQAGVGVGGSSPRQAAISIGFTPSTSQIGQEPPLLQNITLTGTDAAGEAISRTLQNVTTNITGDPGFSATQGTVVR